MTAFDAEDVQAFIQSYVDDHGFLSFLDLQVEDVDDGEMTLRIPYDEKLTNHGAGEGNVHGGIAATIIDTAGGLAIRTTLDEPVTAGVATIDLNVSYLRPARGDLVAEAEVIRVGSTVGVAEVTVTCEDDEGVSTSEASGGSEGADASSGERVEVAVGRGSFRVFE